MTTAPPAVLKPPMELDEATLNGLEARIRIYRASDWGEPGIVVGVDLLEALVAAARKHKP